MPNVRPELLRRFYESCWQGGMAPEQLYEGGTFDEYYALKRVRYPQITRNTAARNAPFDVFRAFAGVYPPEPPPGIPMLRNLHLARRTTLNLCSEMIDLGVERLVRDRIKSISGWDALSRLTQLRTLIVVLSGTETPAAPRLRAEVDNIEILDCTMPCLCVVLASTSARAVNFSAPASHANLSLLAGHASLRELTAGASLVLGLECLAHWPLTAVELGLIEVDDAFRSGIAALSATLTRLAVSSRTPFSPKAFPDIDVFSKLRRVQVNIHEMVYRDEWIACALAHPDIDFVFARMADDAETQSTSMEEIYRGIDILRIERGENVRFEVSCNIAAEVGETNNSDVEERLERIARQAHKQLSWSCESGTFAAHAKQVATCRWMIDQIHVLTDRSIDRSAH